MKKCFHNLIQSGGMTVLLLLACAFPGYTQSNFKRDISYSAKVILQGYNLPVRNNFFPRGNIGGAIGIDYSFNNNGSMLQSFHFGFFNNKNHGKNVFINTQLTYRAKRWKRVEPDISVGIGRIVSFSKRSDPYYSIGDGRWNKSSRQSEGRWQVPVALNLGYKIYNSDRIITPFIGYEAAAIFKYNSAFTILPYSMLTVGSRMSFTRK